MFMNLYSIVGFDDSPIASEAIIPISTKRKPTPQTEIIQFVLLIIL